MRAVCAGLALWFSVLVITPTLDVTIASPTATSWSPR